MIAGVLLLVVLLIGSFVGLYYELSDDEDDDIFLTNILIALILSLKTFVINLNLLGSNDPFSFSLYFTERRWMI